MSKKDLWNRIRDYHFDHLVPPHLSDRVSAMFSGSDASTNAFAHKLSRKLGWTPRFARRAIVEYKKFVYLGNVGPANVTPSKVIDQVWHEHLLFSKAYRDFCRQVLERDFDHNPELVPVGEQTEKYEQQYLDTLDAYYTEFGSEPPDDIWSLPKFKKAARRKPKRNDQSSTDYWSDTTPLCVYYDSGASAGFDGGSGHDHFGGGGDFMGAGAGRTWGDSDSHGHDGGHDGGHGDSSADSGGGDGGSSCSSSCGGGGSD